MAITFPITGVTTTFSATRSPSFTLGTAPATDDVIVAFMASADTATVADISGWVNVLGSATDVESDSNQGFMVYHIVTSGEAGASTVTWTLTNIYGATETGRICTAVLRGVDTADVLAGTAASNLGSGNAATPWTAPTMTPDASSAVLRGYGGNGTQTVTTPPASHTIQSGASATMSAWLYSLDAGGSNGVAVGTADLVPSAGDEFVAITAAFKVAASTVTATGAGSWGSMGGTAAATTKVYPVLAGAWGGLTGTATATVDTPAAGRSLRLTQAGDRRNTQADDARIVQDSLYAVIAEGSGAWGSLTATITATVEHLAVLVGSWGSLTGTATAGTKVYSVLAGAWGALSGTATASTKVYATADGSWGSLTATATAGVEHFATAEGAWGSLTATATATVETPGGATPRITQVGDQRITQAGDRRVTQESADAVVFVAAWGSLVGTASATVEHPATAVGEWGSLTATSSATVEHPAVLVGAWGSLTGTASAGVEHFAIGSGSWGEMSGTASATVTHLVVLVGTWGALTGTASAEIRLFTILVDWVIKYTEPGPETYTEHGIVKGREPALTTWTEPRLVRGREWEAVH